MKIILRIIPAAILLQTLYFKFTAAPESVFIFTKLGVEPYGRIFAGISELLASVLLLIPATQLMGAFLSLGIMAGAIASHIFVLGIDVQNDHGLLFSLACIVALCCIGVLLLQRSRVKQIIKSFLGK